MNTTTLPAAPAAPRHHARARTWHLTPFGKCAWDAGLTIAQLAHAAGLTEGAVRVQLLGVRPLGLGVVLAVARAGTVPAGAVLLAAHMHVQAYPGHPQNSQVVESALEK